MDLLFFPLADRILVHLDKFMLVCVGKIHDLGKGKNYCVMQL